MRLARVALLLVVSVPVFADRFVPRIFARHRPMHPDNAQTVTFEGTATADRVILSYERFTLSTAPDGTHIQTPAEPPTVVEVCDPARTMTQITCTHTMAAPFPAGSLILFTASAERAGGASEETYAFAAGDWPWPDDPIPIRVKGDTKSKLDTVFIPDEDIGVPAFRAQLYDVMETYWKYDPILIWRGVFNFWYSGQTGHYTEFCNFQKPANYSQLLTVADAVALLHKTVLRDCSNIPLMSAEIDDEKAIIHETAHTLYRLQDEYCCNTNYKPQPCVPNIYASLADCQADAPNLGYDPSNCTQLSYETTVKDIWRIDPSTEPACIMGPNQNKATSVFRAACLRRLIWRYKKCVAGECMSEPTCR
jgi:hypothetical protein